MFITHNILHADQKTNVARQVYEIQYMLRMVLRLCIFKVRNTSTPRFFRTSTLLKKTAGPGQLYGTITQNLFVAQFI